MAIQDTFPLPLEVILPVIAAIASFTVAGIYTAWVAKQKPGTKEMLENLRSCETRSSSIFET